MIIWFLRVHILGPITSSIVDMILFCKLQSQFLGPPCQRICFYPIANGIAQLIRSRLVYELIGYEIDYMRFVTLPFANHG